MARENRSWGCARIAGQISNLFFAVSEETVRCLLRKHGLERNHQGDDIGNALLFPDKRVTNADPDGDIVRHSRLGGLLKFYHRDAGSGDKVAA